MKYHCLRRSVYEFSPVFGLQWKRKLPPLAIECSNMVTDILYL